MSSIHSNDTTEGFLALDRRRTDTHISLTKNLVYKNIEAQMRKKIRTIIKISPALEIGNL